MTRKIYYVPHYRSDIDQYVYARPADPTPPDVGRLIAAGQDLRALPIGYTEPGTAMVWHIRTRGGRWLPLAVRHIRSRSREAHLLATVWVAFTKDHSAPAPATGAQEDAR